jgi:dihydrofolate reductase
MSIRPEVVRLEGDHSSSTKEAAMSRLVVTNSVTLDGVMQSPSHPGEDTRGGFERGGWQPPYVDSVMGEVMAKGIAKGGSLLFGRRTYEQFATFWPHQGEDNPYAAVLNERTKYVASTTLSDPLPWQNSVLLEGDALDAVARLKEQPGGDIVVLGSGELVQSLMRHGLVDELVLSIHPLVLGSGRRLFPDGGAPAELKLADSVTTTTGVIIATYQR